MPEPVLFVSIGTPDPEQSDALMEYAEKAPPLLVAAGAVPKTRAKLVEQLVGADAPGTLFVAEFPSVEAVKSVFSSDAYTALIPTRDKAFTDLKFLIMEAF